VGRWSNCGRLPPADLLDVPDDRRPAPAYAHQPSRLDRQTSAARAPGHTQQCMQAGSVTQSFLTSPRLGASPPAAALGGLCRGSGDPARSGGRGSHIFLHDHLLWVSAALRHPLHVGSCGPRAQTAEVRSVPRPHQRGGGPPRRQGPGHQMQRGRPKERAWAAGMGCSRRASKGSRGEDRTGQSLVVAEQAVGIRAVAEPGGPGGRDWSRPL